MVFYTLFLNRAVIAREVSEDGSRVSERKAVFVFIACGAMFHPLLHHQ